MSGLGFTVMVILLAAVIVFGFPTRRRLQRAFRPRPGPHPLRRWIDSLGRRRADRARRRRRRHLRRV